MRRPDASTATQLIDDYDWIWARSDIEAAIRSQRVHLHFLDDRPRHGPGPRSVPEARKQPLRLVCLVPETHGFDQQIVAPPLQHRIHRWAVGVDHIQPLAHPVHGRVAETAVAPHRIRTSGQTARSRGHEVFQAVVVNQRPSHAVPQTEHRDRVVLGVGDHQGQVLVLLGETLEQRQLAEGGRIVNFSSSTTVLMLPGYAAYVATKGAVEQLSHVLAKELGPKKITVNVVSPGPTDTELFGQGKTEEQKQTFARIAALGRLGQPETSPPW